MADVTIEASLVAADTSRRWSNNLVWTTKDIGYAIYINSSTATLQYRKTTDGGATWGSGVDVSASAANVQQFDVFYGKWWTSNAIIHIIWNDPSDEFRYRSLDPSSDTLGTQRTIKTGALTGSGNPGWVNCMMTGCRALGGNLLATAKVDNGGASGALAIQRSVDEGVNWTSRANSMETSADEMMLLPANVADTADAYLIYGDASADELSVKFYDDSANTVGSETTISGAGNYVEAGADYKNWDAMYAGGTIYVVWCNLHNNSAADLKSSSFTANSATPTVNAKTDVLTNTQAVASPRLFYDAVNSAIYCFYLRGTLGSSMHVYYKKSTDGMTTWGTEVQYDEGSAAGFLNCGTGRYAHATDGGRISATWIHDTNDDLLFNKVNSVEAAVAAATRPGLLTLLGVS